MKPARALLLVGVLALPAVLAAPLFSAEAPPPAPAQPAHLPKGTPEPTRCEPEDIAITPDGRTLLVACPGAGTLLALDARTGARVAEVTAGVEPVAVALHPSAPRAWVADRVGVAVREVDLTTWDVVRDLPAGTGPRGVAADREGRTLYVANIRSDDLSVIDLESGREVRRFAVGRGPRSVARSATSGAIFVTSLYPLPAAFQATPSTELTVFDGDNRSLHARHTLTGVTMGRGVDVSPDGRLTAAAIVRPKNLVPMTKLAGGWMMTNALLLVDNESGRVDQVPLDQPNRYFADPHGVRFSPDGTRLYVTSLATHRLLVVDVPRLQATLASLDDAQRADLGDDMGASRAYVAERFAAGESPSAIVLSPDGARLYVTNRFPDTVTVVDAATLRVAATYPLGYAPVPGHVQWGRAQFHDARFSFQGGLACGSCHPEDHYDGLVYDLEPDGLGRDLVDNRSIRAVRDTGPFKWNGKNSALAMQAGPRAANFFLRSTGFPPEELAAVVDYLESVPPVPNPYRPPGAELTEAQERGKVLYEREVDKFGRPIPPEGRCVYCHPGPLGTNRMLFDVGTKAEHDTEAVFDTPHLVNIAESAPYLHDGRCFSLEEIWTVFNPHDTHGVTNDLTKAELNDLIEYLKTF